MSDDRPRRNGQLHTAPEEKNLALKVALARQRVFVPGAVLQRSKIVRAIVIEKILDVEQLQDCSNRIMFREFGVVSDFIQRKRALILMAKHKRAGFPIKKQKVTPHPAVLRGGCEAFSQQFYSTEPSLMQSPLISFLRDLNRLVQKGRYVLRGFETHQTHFPESAPANLSKFSDTPLQQILSVLRRKLLAQVPVKRTSSIRRIG